MEKSEKILKASDQIEHEGVQYTVEAVDGKRVAKLQIKVLPQTPGEDQT